jgi:hypothetical protein
MKNLLLASAAVIALAIAAPLATAQYTTPPTTPAPYATTPAPADPMTPQDDVAPQPDAMATPAPVQSTPVAPAPDPAQTAQAPMPEDPLAQAPMPEDQLAQTTPEGQVAQAPTPESADMQTAEAQTYDSAEAVSTPIDMAALDQHARDAGMPAMPNTPAEVCAPRDVELTTSGSGLNVAKRRQLINAADRASACELRAVVIHSPDGRGAAARQTLIANGVDESLIEVQDADTGGLHVDMQFAGLATSNDQNAAMFNPQQMAMADTSAGAPMMDNGGLPPDSADPLAPETADPNAPAEQQEEPIEPTAFDAPAPDETNDI